MKNKRLKIAGLLLAMVCATQTGFAEDVGNYAALNYAISNYTSPIVFQNNINATEDLNAISGSITINGQGNSLTGNNYSGFSIGNSSSLVLENINLTGFNKAIENNGGTLTLNDVTVAAGTNNTFTQANNGSTTLTGNNTIRSNIASVGTITNQGTLTTSGNVTGSGTFVNEGTYNISGNNSDYKGTYEQSTAGSVTTVTGKFFGGTSNISNGTLNWHTEAIPYDATLVMTGDNTTFNVGADNNQQAALAIGSGSSIAEAVSINVREKSELYVTGGVVDLNNNDIINGTLELTTGTVNVNNGAVAGVLNAKGGNLNLNGGTFVVNDKSKIENNTAVNIASGTLDVQGNVQLNDNDIWTGEVKLSGGDLTVSNRTEAQGNGVLKAESGNLTLESGNLTVGSGSSIADIVNTNIKSNATLNIADGTIAIDTGDTWAGEVKLNGNGTLNYTGVKGDESGKLTATKGNLNVANKTLKIGSGSTIAGDVITKVTSTLDVAGGDVELSNNDTIGGTVRLNSGELKLNNAVVAGTLDAQGGILNLVDGTFVLNSNSTIANAVTTKIAKDKTLQVEGTANLNNNDDWLGIVNLKQGGTLNVSGRDANKGNGQLIAEGGNLNLASGNLTIGANSRIDSAVDTTITGNLNITDGTVAIDTGDTWTGKVTLDSTTGNGTLNYTGVAAGTTNGLLEAKNGKLNVNAGTLEIIGGSSIKETVETTIAGGSKLKISGNTNSSGSVVLDETDNWNGEIELTGGNLTLNNIKNSTTAKLTAKAGTIDIASGTLVVNSGSTIEQAVNTKVNDGVILDVKGEVTIDGTDTWASTGTVKLNNGGDLTVTGRNSNGILDAQGGNLNLASGNLTIGANSTIADAVAANVASTSNLNITDGSVVIGTDDIWVGTVNLDGTGSLDFNGTKDGVNGKLVASNGTLNITEGTLNIVQGSSIGTNVDTTITSALNVNGGNVTLDNNDTWTGVVTLDSGNLTVNNIKPNGNLIANGGKLDIQAGELTLDENSSIDKAVQTVIGTTSTLNVAGATVELGNDDTWTGNGKVNVTDGTLNINITDDGGNGIITATGGNVNLQSGVLNLADGSNLGAGAIVNLAQSTTTNVNGGGITLNGTDTWASSAEVILSSGKVTIDGLISNGKFVANGGDVDITSGKLTIVGDSNIEGANEVAIAQNGSLELKKNTTVNKITGNGNLTLDNKSTLTFDNNSEFSSDLQFVSKDSSTVYITANANSVLDLVKAGTNSGLTITIDGTNADRALTIDGTDIANLNFLNTVNYSGDLTNNGTTSNSGDLTLSGKYITGSGNFNNSNKVTLNSDASGFDGIYTQTAGSTIVSSTGKVFGGVKNIEGGSLKITSADVIDYKNVNLGTGASLTHVTQTADKNVLNSDVVKFSGNNGTVTIKADDGVKANVELASNTTGDGSGNKVVFDSINNLTLGLQDYTGTTEYKLINGTDLNLVEESGDTKNYTFAHLTTDGTATLSFNVKIVDGNTVGTKALETDTVTISGNTDTVFNFGNIYITGEENGALGVYNTKNNVLTGGHFAGQPNNENITYATGATTSWIYDVKSANGGHSISMEIKDFVDEHTLYTMNATEGTRFFQFSQGTTPETYHIDQSLSATAGQRDGVDSQASFTVTGNSMDLSIISGEIYDKTTHEATGDRGSFFNIASGEDVKLDIRNVTIQDAQKSGNGSVVENNSEKAIVTLNGVKVTNNEATGNGGAIYNGVKPNPATAVDGKEIANLVIAGSILNNNSADGNGGAIYNAGNMAVSDTQFSENSATLGGAIYNTGKMVLTNVTVDAATATATNDIYQEATGETILAGTNNISSNISGTGSITNTRVLNISGDNSGYTGKFTQNNNGSTTVTNNFFAGTSTIENGTLNWYTQNDIKETAVLKVQDGTLNIGQDDNQNAVLSIGNESSIADVVSMTINKNSILNVINNGDVTINANDAWAGKVTLAQGGKLAIDGYKKGNGLLTAANGQLDIKNSIVTIAENSSIADLVKTTIDSDTIIQITGGDVTLDGATGDIWSGKIVMTNGNLTIDNITPNGKIQASGGNVTLVENGNLTIEDESVITEGATVDLQAGTTTTVKNNTQNAGLALNTGDIWAGTVQVQEGGLLTINNIDSNKKLLATGGTVNLIDGPLVIENESQIKSAVATTIGQTAVLEIKKDGLVELNGNDSWLGEIKITDGQLDLDGMQGNNKLTATDGGVINLKTGNLDITKGSIIAGNNEQGGSTSINIAKDANLNIIGGDVTINKNDKWDGFINLKSGTLNIEEKNDGILHADGGNLNFSTGTLTIKDGSYINGDITNPDLDVVINLPENSLIEILTGGTVAVTDNDKWDGEVLLNGGVLNYGTTHSGTLTATTGDMNLLEGSILNIQIPSQVADDVNVDIQKGALVNLKEDAIFNLDSKDKWSGMINNAGGKLTTSELTNSTGSGGGLQQTAGSSTFQNNSHIFISDANSYITGGDVNILNNSSLWMGAATAELNVDNLKLAQNSTLNMMNDKINTTNAGNMIVNDRNNVAINISPRDWQHDKFIIGNIKSDENGGTINVSDFDFLGLCPIDRHIQLHVFDAKSIANVNFDATDKQIFTPIGWYDLQSMGGGYYSSNLTKYNPQVFRGQVATMAMWNNQLAIDDMLLNHVSLSSERLLAQGHNANRYAINESQFAPYQYKKEDGGLWFKSYVNFETLSMTQGLNVHNNSYGSIVGADFPVVNMKRGWKFMPTAYVGYNGSHQTFNKVGMYQNGGQAGFMGTFMKNDFIGSVLAYGGGYNNEMSVEGYTDRTGNWFAGTAAKAAYNLHATKHFTVQPTMMLAYNIFGRQNWGTDFGTMGMSSGYLNGINIAPGVNFIYARETWNLYATIQYMYNINDHVDGRAGNVSLSNVDMRHGYLQYGFGANKTWKDRLTSYIQIVFRNGGRTGVGFQLGAQYLFDWFKPKSKKIEKVQVQPVKTQIKSLSMK